jgi:uncharacterized membrane protein YphA (DoxX/SURF4 family)
VLVCICRYILAAVFLMAALTKITDPEGFRDRVLDGAHLWPEVALGVTWFLPWLELTCGACLALGYAVREAALVTAILLVLFLVHAVINHTEPDCGCFLTPWPQPTTAWWPALRNALLLACAAWVAGAGMITESRGLCGDRNR